MQDNILSFFLMTTRGRTYVITRTKTATPTFKIFKITPTIILKQQLLSHYFMSEGDLAPKARFQSAGYKDQGEGRVWQQWQKAQRESRGHPAAQASNPKVGHSPNFAQHCPHGTFLKIRFLRLTFFHSLVATEVRSFIKTLPISDTWGHALHPAQGKGGQTQWESHTSKRRGSL